MPLQFIFSTTRVHFRDSNTADAGLSLIPPTKTHGVVWQTFSVVLSAEDIDHNYTVDGHENTGSGGNSSETSI